MKRQMYITITDPAALAANRVSFNINLTDENHNHVEDWISIGPVEIDFGDLDLDKAREEAIRRIDAEMERKRAEFEKFMLDMKAKRDELLALPAPE